ncbi:MAG: archease, partial [Desulfurococcales archaeon]|nr:archease [Desulfurococcales archaeon]
FLISGRFKLLFEVAISRCGGAVGCRSGYKFLEHTADAYVEVFGGSLEEIFELAAKAMFEVMVDTSKVRPVKHTVIEDSGFDVENALYRWLEDLLIEYCANNMVFGKFKVEYVRKANGDVVFRGIAWGEEFNPELHDPRTEVKAVTYSLMEIGKKDGCWYARVVFDI